MTVKEVLEALEDKDPNAAVMSDEGEEILAVMAISVGEGPEMADSQTVVIMSTEPLGGL